jgi:type VI secretion system protein VasJ
MDAAHLGRTPISPERPSGDDARYDPDFEQLQTEIDKLSSPSASGAVNWEKVALLAAAILLDKSKDLRVACYWALGRLQGHGVDGLTEGLTLLAELAEHFGESLFPRRPQGRAAALRWWVDKTAGALGRLPPQRLDRMRLESLAAALKSLERHLRACTPEPVSLRPVARALETVAIVPPSEAAGAAAEPPQRPPPAAATPPLREPPREAAVPKTSAAAASPAAPLETVKAELSTPAAALGAIGTALDEIRRASTKLLELAPQDPTSYRCRRQAAWMRVATPPPAATDGRTQIPPPPPQIAEELSDLQRRGNWALLLQKSEQRVSQFIFWLDLHRWSDKAAEALGADYSAAGAAVRQETAALIARLPGLDELCFSNGVPFAAPPTREWLRRLLAVNPAPPSPSPAPAPEKEPGAAEDREKTVAAAEALVHADRLAEAIGIIDKPLRASASQREALRWRLALCRILLQARKAELARPHADLLLAAVDHHRLESWDPELALEALEAAWAASFRPGDPAAADRTRELYNRIARIDPARALRLEGR